MSLKDDLQGIIPEEKLALMPGHFNVIGEIAIISLPAGMDDYKESIARAITSRHKGIRTVLNKASRVHGRCRVAGFEMLAGESTITTHREFGFIYRMDVAQVFFNSRLSFERRRVALKSRAGEKVLVPFSGVGPFAVPIASAGARVVALEMSPEACRWLSENAMLNRVSDRICIINGDALDAARMLRSQFDRAVIPAPYGMDHALESISPLVRPGGMIHFYTFKKRHQIEGLIEKYEDMGFQVELCRRCGNVAPAVCRWVFDLLKC